MKIDWFTLAAQIVNFLVLLWILKTFLFGRIVDAMRAREQAIAGQREEIDQLREESKTLVRQARQQQQEWDEQTEQRLEQAKREAHQTKTELIAKAQREADEARLTWIADLQREQHEVQQQFQELFSTEVLATSEHLVQRLADADFHDLMSRHFLGQLALLDPAERQVLVDSLGDVASSETRTASLTVAMSSPWTDQRRQQWQQALGDLLARDLPSDTLLQIEFESLPPGVIGVEIDSPSHRIPWTLQEQITQLSDQVKRNLQRRQMQHAE